jgi:hypothetical protein
MAEVQTLHFYTVGEDFTRLLRNFIEEGRVASVYEILQYGGFPKHLMSDFFEGKYKFVGTTQNGGDLSVIKDETGDFSNGLEQCLRSLLFDFELEQHQVTYMLEKYKDHKHIYALSKMFELEELKKRFGTDNLNAFTIAKIKEECFGVYLFEDLEKVGEFHNGLILPSGDLITCGYQEHNELYPFLQELGLIKSSCWTDCEETIHISSGQISGTLAYHLESPYRSRLDNKLTEQQLYAVFKLRKWISSAYGSYDKVAKLLLDYTGHQEDFGGKWNNLTFLSKYYGKLDLFKLPEFSKLSLDGLQNCLRTSPKYSLPGLLESKFELTENSVKELEETFEKFKNIRKDNELHYFYQEYVDGANGVFHYDRDGFRYNVSENRGDVVQGKTSDYTISKTVLEKLENVGRELYEDIEKPLQVEFVLNGKDVYLVQLRLLENNAERTVVVHPPEETFVLGKTFSYGTLDKVNVKDILVLDSDGDSEQLLEKKALVVKNEVEFSHILALSKALKIPSIFATGDFELPDSGEVQFYAYGPTAWISKVD